MTAIRRIRDLSENVEQQNSQLAALNASKGQSDQSNNQFKRQVAELEHELAEIKRISGGAMAQNETNQELMGLNDRLRGEVDELITAISVLETNVQQRWLMIGGGLMLIGLVLGVSIKARPRRSAWN